jgi:predicted tellurium resistance membrane protein TerC
MDSPIIGAAIALITLVVLEVVLGIDNVIFISILASKLPAGQQARARQIGLLLAMGTRILLLLSLSFLAHLEQPLFTLAGFEVSGRDLVLFVGGLFLVYKATREIHHKMEGEEGEVSTKTAATFGAVVTQIVLLDIVFSIDSVLTAVGMADEIWVMIAAVVIAVLIMLFASGPISDFVGRHPTVKMLALAFLLLIGVNLIVEALHVEIPKGYIYFAMAFSVFVEILNLRASAKKVAKPVHLREAVVPESGVAAVQAVVE